MFNSPWIILETVPSSPSTLPKLLTQSGNCYGWYCTNLGSDKRLYHGYNYSMLNPNQEKKMISYRSPSNCTEAPGRDALCRPCYFPQFWNHWRLQSELRQTSLGFKGNLGKITFCCMRMTPYYTSIGHCRFFDSGDATYQAIWKVFRIRHSLV